MTMAQRSQNKMLRILDGALVSDKKSSWNIAPDKIRTSKTLTTAKKAI
jgi:hypothetical protein